MEQFSSKKMGLFAGGHYEQILAESIDREAPGELTPEDAPFVVGALCFVGRIEEGRSLLRSHRGKLSQVEQTAAQFFLAVALIRSARYDESAELVKANLLSMRANRPSDLIRIFACQGLAFYRFMTGRFPLAQRAVEKALDASVRAGFTYGRILALDLKGHTLVQVGQIAKGLAILEQSRRLATTLGNGPLAEAIGASLIQYRCRYGIFENRVEILRDHLEQTSHPDSYSRAEILLELSRQYLLKGSVDQARLVLNEACQGIYGSSNLLQRVALNLCFGELAFASGDFQQALLLAQSTSASLNSRFDLIGSLQVLGLQLKCLIALGMTSEATAAREQVERLTRLTGAGTGQRMLNRVTGQVTPSANFGEDPLGDLLDLVTLDPPSAIWDILRTGYLSLLYEVLDTPRNEQTIVIDFVVGSLVILDRGLVECHETTVSDQLRKLCVALGAGKQGKEGLVRNVLGYKVYHPLRHDPLLYSATSKLRKVLGSRGSWLETTDDGYQLRPGVKVIVCCGPDKADKKSSRSLDSSAARATPRQLLNRRQLLIVRRLKEHEFIDVRTCRQLFGVSEITASRDLTGLAKIGLVNRLGRGRAICYRAASSGKLGQSLGEPSKGRNL